MEKEPKQEKSKSEQPEEKTTKERVAGMKKVLENFLSLSDDPGLPYEEQKKLLEKSTKGDEEAAKKYLESKKSKYRGNTLSAALMAGEVLLLDSPEILKISEEEVSELRNKLRSARENIQAAIRTQITEKEVKAAMEAFEKAGLPKERHDLALAEIRGQQNQRQDVEAIMDVLDSSSPEVWGIPEENIKDLREDIKEITKKAHEEHPGTITPAEVKEVTELAEELKDLIEKNLK